MQNTKFHYTQNCQLGGEVQNDGNDAGRLQFSPLNYKDSFKDALTLNEFFFF